jgi:hypothetical protein
MMVIHDLATAVLSFEALSIDGHCPALVEGLVRRPAFAGMRPQSVSAKPARVGPLRLALVVNPTGDLDGTEKEAQGVLEAIAAHPNIRAGIWLSETVRARHRAATLVSGLRSEVRLHGRTGRIL